MPSGCSMPPITILCTTPRPGRGDDLEVQEHAVAGAVVALEQQRAPDHLEAEARRGRRPPARPAAERRRRSGRPTSGRGSRRSSRASSSVRAPSTSTQPDPTPDLVVADEIGRGAERRPGGRSGPRASAEARLRTSTRTRPAARRSRRARTARPASARAPRTGSARRSCAPGSVVSARLARTVHCSLPRDTARVRVDHVAVRVLAHSEAELDRPVVAPSPSRRPSRSTPGRSARPSANVSATW